MTQNEANKMLESMKQAEKQTRNKMNQQKSNGIFKRSKTKDW
jgi:hypothetical protein